MACPSPQHTAAKERWTDLFTGIIRFLNLGKMPKSLRF